MPCRLVIHSLCAERRAWRPSLLEEESGFIDFFTEVFEASWKDSMSPQGLPSGAEAAGWLFDRLIYQGWPTNRDAPDLVLNELNIPMLHSAVLRSLRLTGRPDLIDEQLLAADHIWFAMKCLMERSRAGRGDPELASRLKSMVEASRCKGNALLHRVVAEIGGSRAMPPPTGTGRGCEAGIADTGISCKLRRCSSCLIRGKRRFQSGVSLAV